MLATEKGRGVGTTREARRFRRTLGQESGAEIVEFALVAPLVFIFIFGIIYGLLTAAAQLSLSHAASVGVRYATIPVDAALDVYPSPAAVQAKVLDSTPFFDASQCTTSVPATGSPNEAFTLRVSCEFPNPAGAALSGLSGLFGGSPGYDSSLILSTDVTGRRE